MTYVCTGTGLLRTARMPLKQPLPDLPEPPAGSTGTVNELVVAAWLSWLASVWQLPVLADAVRTASPDLTRAVDGLLSTAANAEGCDSGDLSPQDVQRVCTSVLHYVLRSRYRATPFGLFAATAPLQLGESVHIPTPAEETVTARADARWMHAVLDQLHTDPAVLEHVSVVADPTCQTGADYVVAPYRPGAVRPDETRAVATPPLQDLLMLAKRPILASVAADQLMATYPQAPRSVVLGMIGKAVRCGFLHSDLRPSALDPFPLEHVRSFLEQAATAEGQSSLPGRGMLGVLQQIGDRLAAVQTGQPVEAAAQTMGEVHESDFYPVMLDVHRREPATIPRRVAADMAAALDVVARISAMPTGTAAWSEYRARFFERYSLGVLVPVLDLLDPVSGLGYPAGFRGSSADKPDRPYTDRDAHLHRRLQQVLLAAEPELVLTDTDLARLGHHNEMVWPSTDVTFTLRASSAEAIERGEYDLTVDGIGFAAGALTGRFTPLLSPQEQQRVISAHENVPTLDEDAIRVQVCTPPLRRKAQNLHSSIRLAAQVLAVGEHTGRSSMWLEEIAVAASMERLYLVHVPTGRRLEPFIANTVDLQRLTDPVARFLAEVTRSHLPLMTPFDWGTSVDLPFLPRVRYRNAILSRARWLLTASDLRQDLDPVTAVRAWRQRYRVPTTVLAGDTDRRLRLDLTVPAHCRMLAQMVTRHEGALRVQEAPGDEAFGWLGSAGQITLTYVSDQPPAPVTTRTLSPVLLNRGDTRWPGLDSSVLLRIDTDTTRTAHVFAAGLSDLLDSTEGIQRWWFIRYRDPRPHLRIRMKLRQPEAFGAVAARTAAWAAQAHRAHLVTGISWHTDLPETGRYGTGSVLTAAEMCFAADSRAALAQDAPGRELAEREGLLVAGLLDITQHVVGDHLQALRLWDARPTPKGSSPVFDRAARSLAMRLSADPQGRDRGDLASLAGAEVAQAWKVRAQALDEYAAVLRTQGHEPVQVLDALLHMHHIRAHGIAPEHEIYTRRCARELAHSLLARRKVAS